MRPKHQVHVGWDHSRGQLGIWIRIEDPRTGELHILTEEGWKKHYPGVETSPTVFLSSDEGDAFLQQVIAQYRPIVRTNSDQIEALKNHLADMRRIVFKSDET